MKSRDAWTHFCSSLYYNPTLGLKLDLSRMGLADDYVAEMETRMAEVFSDMGELEGGAIANPDEERMVGHYWLRAPDLAPHPELADEIVASWKQIETFASAVHGGTLRPPQAERFDQMLLIGIGGSALGPQFVAQALGTTDDKLTPHFLDNTDPDGFDRVLQNLGEQLRQTLVIVISKSGGTPEPRNGMLETVAAYRKQGLEFGQHAIAITSTGSQLDQIATRENFLATFPLWDWVGGRTSETATVGLVPAALQGIDFKAFLHGAALMDEATRSEQIAYNPAALLALAWYHECGGAGQKDMVILPYKDRLSLFSRYLQQLVMESLGKRHDLDGKTVHQGLAVYGNKGSTDQHAYVQQLRDGVHNFFVTFIEVLRDRQGESIEVEPGITSGDYLHGFLLGTRQALYESGRHSLTITIEEINPQTIGMLIALYERAVGFYASLINVNAYHQPGVEAGKRAAATVLDLQTRLLELLAERGEQGGTCEELAAALNATDEIETVFSLLQHLAANPDRGIVKSPAESLFDSIYSFKNRT
jgi:glucose-6-phosphate isomerase